MNLTSPGVPPLNWGGALAYDEKSDLMVLFGGIYPWPNEMRVETWTLELRSLTWKNVTPSVSPPWRYGHAMTYDAKRGHVFMTGGCCATGVGYPFEHLMDAWFYNSTQNSWQNVTPASGPKGRFDPALVYDPGSDRYLMFGGGLTHGLGTLTFDDTWVFDPVGLNWTRLMPHQSPDGRYTSSAVYDQVGKRMLLFGGACCHTDTPPSGYYFDDLWSYDPPYFPPRPEDVKKIPFPGAEALVAVAAAMAFALLQRSRGRRRCPVLRPA
ncbi:MAG TPA: kelch repeat-containing protein [Thermoplasmata archaeon]|nr:kelch repeat-containing protein [Thermoplasmata archaeon]